MERRVTLRDIAKRTGYHYSTVSLALRGDLRIRGGTRETILRVAKELGYRPDPMLGKLAAYRRGLKHPVSAASMAYLVNWSSRELWGKEHSETRFLEGAKRRANELGYHLEEVWANEPKLTGRRLSEILSTRNYDGLVVARTPSGRGHLGLDWSQFSAVKIGHSLVYPRLHCVENNQYQIMQLAIRTLRRKGYRRVGLAMRALSDETVNHGWKAGYLVETDRPGFERIPMLITKNWNAATFKKWFQRYNPQVVVSVHLKILNWLRELGVRVPDDVGYVDLDCNDRSGARAGVYQRYEQVGAAAVNALNGLIMHSERGIPETPQLILLEGMWVDGATLKDKVRSPARKRSSRFVNKK
jgi:LacI family transcriptional regulator